MIAVIENIIDAFINALDLLPFFMLAWPWAVTASIRG